MRYAGILKNDFTAKGVCVTLFVQGCPHQCKGCHNPESWDPKGGQPFQIGKTDHELLDALRANNIHRDLCIQGGEPFSPYAIHLTRYVVEMVKRLMPNTKIYVWSGYTFEELEKNEAAMYILQKCDLLIDGPYIEEERDITLPLRGSRNQRIIDLTNIK